jgi:hypothetical protein
MKPGVKKEVTKDGVKYYGKVQFYSKATGYMNYFIGPYNTRQLALQAAKTAIKTAEY